MKIIVGNAWPYANGSLHIGRISSWIPGDVIARYHRLKGDDVIFVSGSDCHGTPILNKAKEMDKSPKTVSSYFHREFKRTFERLNFSLDIFSKTDNEGHTKKVQEFILKLYHNELIYSKDVEEYYCPKCREVIGDRSMKGICPHCKKITTGEQCDNCSKLIDPIQLSNKACINCGSVPMLRTNKQLFFKLSIFEEYINSLVEKDLGWRKNAIELTKKYVKEGLRDRTLSRDIDWGIEVPIEGFKDKKIYVWIEAILSYLTSTMDYLGDDKEINKYWNSEDSRVYLVHGKENIPFHSIILPSILKGIGYDKTNFRILSSEYMSLEGKKFSSNRNWVIWVNYLSDNYSEDIIRYYLLKYGPEKRNANFSWRDFIKVNNNELLGVYGNFINRILTFINKYYEGRFTIKEVNEDIMKNIKDAYNFIGSEIELGNMNSALKKILDIVELGNEYFDDNKPWLLLKSNPQEAKQVIGSCLYIVINLCNLLEPFIPKGAEKLRKMLNVSIQSWEPLHKKEISLESIDFLFERIPVSRIKEELKILKNKRK